MKIISAAEARKRFAQITDDVRMSKTTYSIVRHGKEVARIVPPTDSAAPRISPELKRELGNFFERYDDALKELANR